MQIKVDTPERLVITDRPVVIATILLGVLVILIGFAMATAVAGEWTVAAILLVVMAILGGLSAVFIRRSDLILDRPTATVHLHSSTLLGKTWLSWPLSDLAGATVQSSRSEDSGMTYRPALLLTDGRTHPLTPVYTSGQGANRAVAAIQRWLTGAAAVV
jgi:hypothetical protein